MSVLSSYVLLLLLLCISFHACNGRRLGASSKEISERKFLLPNKNDEKVSPETTSVTTKSKPSQSGKPKEAIDQDNKVKQTQVDKGYQISKNLKGKDIRGKAVKTSGSKQNDHDESLVSISWRVPHKKRGEKQPGFNLDYSPPKTHPPVHN